MSLRTLCPKHGQWVVDRFGTGERTKYVTLGIVNALERDPAYREMWAAKGQLRRDEFEAACVELVAPHGGSVCCLIGDVVMMEIIDAVPNG